MPSTAATAKISRGTIMADTSKLAALTDDQREALRRRLDVFDQSIAQLEKQREPWDKAIAALQEIREDVIEDVTGAELAGNREGCDRLLFIGEQGHRCVDGPILCVACAPTWSDLKAQYADKRAKGEPVADADDVAIDGRIAAGDGDKPYVWEL
jgi:hypothetical protein